MKFRGVLMRFLAVLALCLSMFASPSYAAPPACDATREGTIIYNKDSKLVQFCNGSAWIGMVAKIGGTGDTLSDLSCQNDEVPVWNGSAWVCGTGGGDSLWSDSGQGYLIYDGEKGVKLANITGMAMPQISMADLGCAANEILKWDGDSWECAADGGVGALSCVRREDSGTGSTRTASCNAGEVMTGGGCRSNGSTNPAWQGYPDTDSTYRCSFESNLGTKTAYAICCTIQ
jgi:hypothetical protein